MTDEARERRDLGAAGIPCDGVIQPGGVSNRAVTEDDWGCPYDQPLNWLTQTGEEVEHRAVELGRLFHIGDVGRAVDNDLARVRDLPNHHVARP